MGKFCKTYKVPCACVTCYGVECALSPKTRGEAEILRGVKLARDGQILEDIQGLGSSPGLGLPLRPDPAEDDSPAPSAPMPRQAPPMGAAGTLPPPLPKPTAVPESVLLHQQSEPPSRRRQIYAGAVIVLAATACAGVLMLGTYYVIDWMKPAPVEVVGRKVAVVPPPAEAPPPESPAPVAEATPPSEPAAPALVEKLALSDVITGLQPSSSSSFVLPPPSPKEQLAARVEEYKKAGNLDVKAGDFAAARVSYQAAVEADPLYYEGWNNLANTYNDEGKHAEAEPIYRRGLAIEPDSVNLHFNLGNSHYRAKQYQEALTEFNQVLAQNPNDIDAHLLAGISHYKLGQFAEASKHFQTVTVINPENADGYFNMALALRRQGQDALARVYYRDALRLNPDLRTVARN
ncbi:tetratricopeptide repeat protein [Candidatus Sumerlaeota bacterium]|nr:tetratricopeptide repeat protein [Candidatus Sumerlaeota bacterium]